MQNNILSDDPEQMLMQNVPEYCTEVVIANEVVSEYRHVKHHLVDDVLEVVVGASRNNEEDVEDAVRKLYGA